MIEQFLAEGPMESLLLLAIMPIGAAIILVGTLFISFNRRRKRNKMKLGIQPSKQHQPMASANPAEAANSEPPEEKEKSPLDRLFAPEVEEEELDLDILRRGLDKEPESEPEPEPAPPPQPESQPKPRPTPAQPAAELMRLLRHPETGQLMVEIGGKQYTKLAEVTDKEIGRDILKLAAHLLAFTNGVVATDTGVKPVYKPKVGQTPEPVAPAEKSASSPPAERPPAAAQQDAFLASLRSQSAPAPSPSPAAPGLFGRGRTSATKSELPGLLNLADEINEIVQERLSYSPLAGKVFLEVTSAPDGGININVNGVNYSSPDEIPDETIKQLIKDSIKQWERS